MKKNGVLAFGLDGATFRIIDPLIKKGKLPTLKKLIDNGISNNLQTTIPPVSTSAWSSFATAVNPGKHGILDFTYRIPHSWKSKPVNAYNRKGLTIWELLSNVNKTVGIVNIPLTYPPSSVNGFMISGFPLPEGCNDYTYPKELASILMNKGWDLSDIATQAYSTSQFDSFLDGLYRRIRDRTEAVLYLMGEFDLDFLMIHLLETDKVQHEFWKFMEKKNHNSDTMSKKYGNAIENIFIEADKRIDQVIKSVDEDVTVIVLSDHGFCSSKYFIHPNTWLLNEQYIQFKRDPILRIKTSLFRLGLTPSNLFKLQPRGLQARITKNVDSKYHKKVGTSFLEKVRDAFSRTLFLSFDDVDWMNTKAYALGNSGIGQIFVNIQESKYETVAISPKDLEPIKLEIISKIKNISVDGVRLVDDVYRREEIYSEPYINEAANIIVIFKDFNYTAVQTPIFLSNKLVERNFTARGESSHDMIGVLIMKGPWINKSKNRGKAEIIDVMPTILYLLNASIPTNIDGKILMKNIQTSFLKKRKPKYQEIASKTFSESRKITEEEERLIMQSLSRMGYV